MAIALLAVGALGGLLLSSDRDGPGVPEATRQNTESQQVAEPNAEASSDPPVAEVLPDPKPDATVEEPDEPPQESTTRDHAAELDETETLPEDMPEHESTAPATPSHSGMDADDLFATLHRYVIALDAGELREAHDLLSPSLQGQTGWRFEDFRDFWTGYLVGARLVDIEQIDVASGEIVTTIDYELVGNGLSRERIRLRVVPGPDGDGVIDVYYVLRAERLS